MTINKLQFAILSLLIIAMSLAISGVIYCQNYTINPDGILYLTIAENFHGLHNAFSMYEWPFYSVMIYYFSMIFHIGFISSAFVLNAALQALIILFFLFICREISRSKIILLLCSIVILTYPLLNGYRDYIMRDFGYWAFFLCGIWGLVRYTKHLNLTNIMIYYVGFSIGFLFRVEACLFFALAPLSLLFLKNTSLKIRLKMILMLCIPGLVLILSLLMYFSFVKKESLFSIGRIPEVLNFIHHCFRHLLEQFYNISTNIQDKALPVNAKNSAPHIAFFGLLGYTIQKLITGVGVLYWLLFIYAHYYTRTSIPLNIQRILYFIMLVYIGLLSYFIFTQYFLVTRYMLAMSFLVLLWTPFAIIDIYKKWKIKSPDFWGRSWVFPVIILWLIFYAISGIGNFGPSKIHINNGANWLINHAPTNARVCTNNVYLLFKVKGANADFVNDIGFTAHKMQQLKKFDCDYYAISINRKHPQQMKKLQLLMKKDSIKVWKNKRGDTLFLYQTKPTNKDTTIW